MNFQNNNNQNNYFVSMQRRFNREDFIVCLKPEQIQRSAKERIFREMVRGQIDYSVYGGYFLDSKFLENLLIAADNELRNNSCVAEALGYYDMHVCPGSALVISNKTRYEQLRYIYSILCSRLNALKLTGDIGTLIDIQYVLADFRNVM
jgi:hypothetical protein